MSWFNKKAAPVKQPIVVGVESLSVDTLHTQLESLEQEFAANGFMIRLMKFPSHSAEENIPGLFAAPELLQSGQSVGVVAAVDRAKSFSQPLSAATQPEALLFTGGVLSTAGWLSTGLPEYSERVSLYRWLDELEYAVFSRRRPDLTVFLDFLPDHVDIAEIETLPVGWGDRALPTIGELRERYLEAARLLPGTKVLSCFRGTLLKPDAEIRNELWNLVRRITLKANVPNN